MILTFDKPSMEEIEAEMITHLRTRGFVVEVPHAWESVKGFCERRGIARMTFYRRLRARGCPRVDLILTKGKSIAKLASNSLFEAWMEKKQ